MGIKSLPRALLFSMIVIVAISLNGSAPVTQPTMVLRYGDPGPVPSWVEMLAERKMVDDVAACDEIRELILKERKLLDQWRQGQAGAEAALAEFIRTSFARQVPGVHTDSALQYCLFWMRRDIVRGCIDLARQDMHSAERNPSEQAALYANRIGLGGHEKALCKRMKTDVADYDASLRLMVVNPCCSKKRQESDSKASALKSENILKAIDECLGDKGARRLTLAKTLGLLEDWFRGSQHIGLDKIAASYVDRILRLSPKEGLWILYYLEEEFGNDAAYKAFLLQMQRLMNDGRTSVGGYVQEQLQRIISLCTETADDVDVKFDE